MYFATQQCQQTVNFVNMICCVQRYYETFFLAELSALVYKKVKKSVAHKTYPQCLKYAPSDWQ